MKSLQPVLIPVVLLVAGAAVLFGAAAGNGTNNAGGGAKAALPNKPLRFALPAGAAPRPPVKPLVLARLNGQASAETGPRLGGDQFVIDELALPGGIARDEKGNGKGNGLERRQPMRDVNQIMIDAGESYDRPLRGGASDIVFVSFLATATPGTVIGVGGAWLGVTSEGMVKVGERKGRNLEWRQVGFPRPIVGIGDKDYVILPTITVRIDPQAGVWDYFADSELVAEDIKLDDSPPGSNRDFDFTAGVGGASLTGLAVSDENPLFLDENRNGIDDAFEKRKGNGQLLPATAQVADRATLAKALRDENNLKRKASAPNRDALKATVDAKAPRAAKTSSK